MEDEYKRIRFMRLLNYSLGSSFPTFISNLPRRFAIPIAIKL